MKRLEDRIWEHLRNEGVSVCPEVLANCFLGSGPAVVGARVINTVLARDRRFKRTETGWEAAALVAEESPRLADSEWIVLGGEFLSVGTGKESLISITRYDPRPGRSQTGAVPSDKIFPAVRTELYLVDSPRAPRSLPAEIQDRWGIPCSLIAERRLLCLLDELLVRPGLFLRQFSAGPLSSPLALLEATGTGLPEHCYPLPELVRLVFPDQARPGLEETLSFLHVESRGETPLHTELKALPELLPTLLEELVAADLERLADIPNKLGEFFKPFDFAGRAFSAADLDNLVAAPGVYLLYAGDDRVVYVGKSVNVRRRVSGYFRFLADNDEKLAKIQALTHRVGAYPSGSDLEASLEEARLIREIRPEINTQMEVLSLQDERPLTEPVVALLPHTDPSRAQVFVLLPEGLVAHRAVDRQAPDVLELQRFLEETCGARVKPVGADSAGFPLALRWLRRNTHRVGFFKYHDHPNAASAATTVLALMRELPL